MQDTEANFSDFLTELTKMGELFCDTLSKERQVQYWLLLAHRMTLDEWRYACWQAMSRETFHKVPVPAALWEYVLEYRANRHDEQSWQETRLLPQATPSMQEDALREVRQIIEALREHGVGEEQEPAPRFRQGPLHPAYRTPETDLLARKHQLRQQAEQVTQQEPLYEP
jgi:hypothetical protein